MATRMPDRYAPEFRILINGREIPAALRRSITSVRYEDGMNAADRVEIGIANTDQRWTQQYIRGLGFRPFPVGLPPMPTRVQAGPVPHIPGAPPTPSNAVSPPGIPLGPLGGGGGASLFDIDNRLTLALGYASDRLEEVFDGEITGVQASFPNAGVPTLTVVAHDRLHRMTEGKYSRGFGPLPDALIATIVSAENRLIPLIDPAVQGASTALAVVNAIFSGTGRKQQNQSDLDLIKEIAKTYDADFWVEEDTIFFSRFMPKEYLPRLTLTWGESLLDFSPQANLVGRVVGVAMKFTLREIPLAFLVHVHWDFEREALGVRVLPSFGASGIRQSAGPTITIADQPITSPGDLINSALSAARELRNKLNNRLTGTGTVVGDPRIRAGAVIRLVGLGPNFSGPYRVSSATHTIDAGGYRTSFQVNKEIIP